MPGGSDAIGDIDRSRPKGFPLSLRRKLADCLEGEGLNDHMIWLVVFS